MKYVRKAIGLLGVVFGYSKCPVCGYWAFNGYECFDCGYKTH